MHEVVNLNRYRESVKRREARPEAEGNRLKHEQSKHDRLRAIRQSARDGADHRATRREDVPAPGGG